VYGIKKWRGSVISLTGGIDRGTNIEFFENCGCGKSGICGKRSRLKNEMETVREGRLPSHGWIHPQNGPTILTKSFERLYWSSL
jgi:hypothetical protein